MLVKYSYTHAYASRFEVQWVYLSRPLILIQPTLSLADCLTKALQTHMQL